MSYHYRIQVSYPAGHGRIVLRKDPDWDTPIDPASTDDSLNVFEITHPEPYFYFKPCLVRDDGFKWSGGANYLAVADEEDSEEVYPRFFTDGNGVITPLEAFTCSETGKEHLVRTYLPAGYQENPLKRYPVLYMHDGNNLFFPAEAFLGQEWQVDDTMDLLDNMNIINKVIVVGVWPNEREVEYTKPGYEAYGRFIVRDLKPVVDRRLRTRTEPTHTAVMGSSLGGVVSLYLAWQFPDVFGMAACMSSTFSYRDDLFRRVAREKKRDIRIYLDSGGPGDNFEVTRRMRDLLMLRGYKLGSGLLYAAFPADRHNERYWSMRSHLPFQFFFSKLPRFPTRPAPR